MTTTGQRLREIRHKRHKTLADVANAIGMTSTSISKYESDRVKNIPHENLQALADYLDVSVSYILGLDEEEQASALILTIDEQILIEQFRKLSFEDQETVRILTDRLLLAAKAREEDNYVQLHL